MLAPAGCGSRIAIISARSGGEAHSVIAQELALDVHPERAGFAPGVGRLEGDKQVVDIGWHDLATDRKAAEGVEVGGHHLDVPGSDPDRLSHGDGFVHGAPTSPPASHPAGLRAPA